MKRRRAEVTVACANDSKPACALSWPLTSVSYQTWPAFSQLCPPMSSAARAKARLGIPELIWTPPLSVVGHDIVRHGAHLQIPADLGVVVRRSRFPHRSQCFRIDPRHEESLADEPVSLGRSLAEHLLFGHRGKNVADALVQGAGLVLISQSDGELGDTVRVLVRHHIHRLGEAVKDLPISIAKDQLSSVPECVVVITPVVDGDGDRAATSVNGLPAELAVEHVPNLTG